MPNFKEYTVEGDFKRTLMLGVVVHAFNPSTQKAEAGRFLSSRPAWSTK
jgi:major histocompatibility complex class I